jgi:dTDP-4-amino-4,6-dideoxygalactose transaminase
MSIFISSIPTIQEDDLNLLRRLLKQENIEDIDITLPGFSQKQHFFTNTGRSSFYLILKALGISQGDEVIIQSFTCMALTVPLIWLNVKPIYADINLKTYNLTLDSIKQLITEKTKAIVVQHTFGIPAEIENIKEYIDKLNQERKNKIYLIEDCAHCLNIKKGEKYLGQFGDAAFFSFGQDKVITTTQGGCAVANNEEVEKNLKSIYKEIPEMPKSMVKYNLQYPLLWNRIKDLYYKPLLLANSKYFSKFTIGKFLILLYRFLGLIKQQASKNNFGDPNTDIYKLSIAQKHLLHNQLQKLPKYTKHRNKIVEIYSKDLNLNLEGFLIRYPVIVDDPSLIKRQLQNEHIIIGNWYNYPVIPRGIDLNKVNYKKGSCPNTESIIDNIINLPTDIHVSENIAHQIANTIKPHML